MQEAITIKTAGGMELSLPIAAVGSRSYAFLIDWHIRLLLALAWLLIFFLLFLFLDVIDGTAIFGGESSTILGYVGVAPAIAIYFLYHPVLEIAMLGRTPGKRMAGVRIVSLDGHTPTIGALLVRNIFRLIDSLPAFYVLGLTVAFLTPKQVRIGDIAAQTVLVYEEKPKTRTIDVVTAMAESTSFTHAQVEVLQELLERWQELSKKVRVDLARQFLESMGEKVPENFRKNELDRWLYSRLQLLSQGGRLHE